MSRFCASVRRTDLEVVLRRAAVDNREELLSICSDLLSSEGCLFFSAISSCFNSAVTKN